MLEYQFLFNYLQLCSSNLAPVSCICLVSTVSLCRTRVTVKLDGQNVKLSSLNDKVS